MTRRSRNAPGRKLRPPLVAGVLSVASIVGALLLLTPLLGAWSHRLDVPPDTISCHPGPWGDLAYRRILLEPPPEVVSPSTWMGRPERWYFGSATTAELVRLLRDAGLRESDIAEVAATAVRDDNSTGMVAYPPAALLEQMDEGCRASLYTQLGRWPENALHRTPFHIRPSASAEWFAAESISPRTASLIRRFTYPNGPFIAFSDLRTVLGNVPEPAEQKGLLQVLYRQSALLPVLVVRPDSDVDELARYWGAQGRESEVRPLLASAARGGGARIGLALLLPPTVRNFLYSYAANRPDVWEDCHWIAMNFFMKEPDSRFLDPRFVQKEVLGSYMLVSTNYVHGSGRYQLGDLLVFRDPQQQIVHSCNYIADNIVFTKNGGAQRSACAFMDLQDVVDQYSLPDPPQVLVFRLPDAGSARTN